jgi:RNA polymerase subunit RPABC4/transcription elongation factor Spt4
LWFNMLALVISGNIKSRLEKDAMTLEEPKSIECPECEKKQLTTIWRSINVTLDPDARASLFEGKINVFECDSCGYSGFIPVPLMYHDMDRKFCVQYYPFELLDKEDFFIQFDAEGCLSTKAFADINLPEYMRRQHIVFVMDEMIRYIDFRERLSKAGN